MARKLIDISVPLQNDVPADPPGNHPTIQYIDHQQGLPRMLQFFDGLKARGHQALLLLPIMRGCRGTPPSTLGTTLGRAPHSDTSLCVSTCNTVLGGVAGGAVMGGSKLRF